jgi:hypothetical protein
VVSSGSGGTTRVAILGNTIREVPGGIFVGAIDTFAGGGGPPTLEARVEGNTVSNMASDADGGSHGILAKPGSQAGSSPIVCLNISANTVTAPLIGILVTPSPLTATPTILLQDYAGGSVETYLQNRNPAATGTFGGVSYDDGNGTTGSGSCVTP